MVSVVGSTWYALLTLYETKGRRESIWLLSAVTLRKSSGLILLPLTLVCIAHFHITPHDQRYRLFSD
jgi:hypothetical protein